ncbi:branched-chain amino acid ABC transporter substrate-binding protein [Pararhizobium sp.]|uniref:branched-chain amino acid ABC transporter substrate-binding protein n=1 Tax=Pararhizobium sp. TaxID=1977563 RepID=UPI00271F60F6|nr:branched-chain amino acid ABC transporter substrate-binding protein [Pararhizobium sp.]MDO9417136.1 branched-chain amino acid ABC transporter substrate-binding protein [Pararhizobium sp.]
MIRPARLALLAACLLPAATAMAADMKIAVVAPDAGSFALLGKQIRDGATFAAKDSGTEIVPIAESCEPDAGGETAKALISAGVDAAIGFLCSESLEATLPLLTEAQIPAITVSVRSGILMEDAVKNKWPLFRLAPTGDAEAKKIVTEITSRWKDKSFALIEDGTIYSRELVETVRTALEEIGMKPVFTDTYRPTQEQQVALVRRLAKTGATHVFISGDRNDTAIIARDAKSEKLALTIMGGDALTAANQPVPLPDGVLAVTLMDPATTPDGKAVADALRQAKIEPEGYVLPAFAAVSLLEQAHELSGESDQPLAASLLNGPFSTVLGSIGFTAGHERSDNPYQLMQWQGSRFVPVKALDETQ